MVSKIQIKNLVKYKKQKWNYIEQMLWQGDCARKTMQSPINIETMKIFPSEEAFYFNFQFYNNITSVVTLDEEEVIVNFSGNNTGSLQLYYSSENNKDIQITRNFTLSRMTFKFPAEHTVDGNRLDGEIYFLFNEVGNDEVFNNNNYY